MNIGVELPSTGSVGRSSLDDLLEATATSMARRAFGKRVAAVGATLLGIKMFDPMVLLAQSNCNTCYSSHCSTCWTWTGYCTSPDGLSSIDSTCDCSGSSGCRCAPFKAAITVCNGGSYSAWCPTNLC